MTAKKARLVILVLTAGFGDGHNTAARNTSAALEKLMPGEQALVVDVFDEAQPVTAPVMKSFYQMLITRAPSVWAWIYGMSAKVSFEGSPDFLAALRNTLSRLLYQHQPRVIICSYPIYSKLLLQLRAKGQPVPPIHTIITDSISIHPIWMIAPSAAYYVADEDSKVSAIALGAPSQQVHVTGFPVSLDFLKEPAAEACASTHGKILYLPSTGVSHVEKTLESLRPLLQEGVKLTLPVGKHASRLYHVLNRFTDSLPGASIEIIGWTNLIPHLLQTHDLVICKAGGAILHEALAASCPAIIDFVVPGQEEGNAELLTRHGCGITTNSPADTGAKAAGLLANNRAIARSMKSKMRHLNEPDAAMKIAQLVLDSQSA
jgi:processive 1,2-diacylglycerol beta-glucosyltransferase